ncbi:PilL N-terminal domain-containing protein [Burkholderia pseudomallei]|uniref:PFGI-1 class ICE element type IV pilus protein PilL2 n=1 Tax=Burkholderia pseudomallei TaxID=28450 RepID=UPI0009B295A9|nr:PilL N-terminal domain-containing protein [Burkholderia pseudomallei]MDY7815205.1 PilL N-terminal domain-containing protein [Burkholderia pseudomallei]MDY7861766.1 PilL N-terminal domain-containing protein [Burkholderia pseudomallei]
MPTLLSHFQRGSHVAGGVLVAILLAGCATSASVPAPSTSLPAMIEPSTAPAGALPVVRYGRYTLIDLTPTDEQRDLMRQVVDVSIPATANATVGDALRYVLQRSGYRLCDDGTAPAPSLYALPLPAAHQHLGPLTLHDALTVLAGPRWTLHVDERTRQVCFAPLTDTPSDLPSPPPSDPDMASGALPATLAQPSDGDQP